MYLQHFGLTHAPLDKGQQAPLWDDGLMEQRQTRFKWLLDSPGIGLFTGESGVGKTAVLRQLTTALNPHRHHLIYLPETDFGRVDIYRGLALALGLEPAFRRAQVWREIKTHIAELANVKQQLPVWIIDEAQNLPTAFFRDFPAFLNYEFDARNLMTVWLVGTPQLHQVLRRAPYTSLYSRIQVKLSLQGINEPAQYKALITHAFEVAGCHQTLLSDSGCELLRQASQGNPRTTGLLLNTALRLACEQKKNHLPDDIIEQSIEVSRP
jgi:type II secretory pathway predicted ATPase ExeA